MRHTTTHTLPVVLPMHHDHVTPITNCLCYTIDVMYYLISRDPQQKQKEREMISFEDYTHTHAQAMLIFQKLEQEYLDHISELLLHGKAQAMSKEIHDKVNCLLKTDASFQRD